VNSLATIDEAFEFVHNGASIKQQDGASGIPITRIETIWNATIDQERFGYANLEDTSEYTNHLLEDGDILMSHINSPKHLGKCAIYRNKPEKLIHGMNLLNLRPNKNLLVPQFAFYYLSSNGFREAITKISNQSVNQASFSTTSLKKLKIPMPPLAEQQKIAAILDAADSLRQKDQLLVERYSALSQSLFLEMFGDPMTNPMGWECEKFGSIGNLDRGKSKHRPRNAPELLGGDYPLIQTGDVANCDGHIKHYSSTYSEVGLRQSKMWKAGTLCITIAANIAKTGILDFDACFPDSVVGFTPNKKTNIEYVQRWLSFLQKILEDSAPMAAQKNINLKILRELIVPLPPIELQNQFAERIQLIEAQKQQAQRSLEKSEALFNSLLQRAFMGELTAKMAA
jgi:type I restriction enzyme, S subunit